MNLLLFFLIYFPFGSRGEFWRRKWHSSVIARDWLYIYGGQIALTKGNYDLENSIISIDLSKTWKNTTLTPIDNELPPDVYPLNSEALWFDDKRNIIYTFGGDNSDIEDYVSLSDTMWGFTPNDKGGGGWAEVLGPVGHKPFPSDLHGTTSGMFIGDDNDGYYLGGYISKTTTLNGPDNFYNNTGLLKFNFESLTITNSSGPDLMFDFGALVNVPIYDPNGVLLAFGGLNDQKSEIGFNNINIFDKKDHKWYSQTAEGDIPQPRSLFCAVGAHGKEGTSFEIIIHGGSEFAGPKGKNTSEVYVLSLPAFRWFRANHTSDSPRAAHTCHATNTSQMIMIGGQNPRDSNETIGDEAFGSTKDPWDQGIAVFDMTTLQFTDTYDPKADPYEPPYVIQQYYNDTSHSRYPSNWTSSKVKAIFENQSSSRVHLGRGALIGLIVGCIAGSFLLFGIIVIYMMKKGRRREGEKKNADQEVSSISEATVQNEFDNNDPHFHEMSSFDQEPREIRSMIDPGTDDRAELSDSSIRSPLAEMDSSHHQHASTLGVYTRI